MNRSQLFAMAALLLAAGAVAAGEYVTCESIDNRYRECRIDTRGDVQLVDRLSRADCRPGSDWGLKRGRVWVANGCRAVFASSSYDYDRRPQGGSRVVCESHDDRYAVCGIDTRRGVRLVERLSRSDCFEGRDWGLTRGGVWVDNGCRAVFQTGGGRGYDGHHDGGHRPSGEWFDEPFGPNRVRCESRDDRYAECPMNTTGRVYVVEQLSRSACYEGRDWGLARGGVWVRNGCRAIFESTGGRGRR